MHKLYLFPLTSLLVVALNIFFAKTLSCDLNEGFAFGIHIQDLDLISILFVLVLFLLSILNNGCKRSVLLSIGILGVGNAYERIFSGYICDYISLLGISFNIIDVMIVAYVCFGIICFLRKDEKKD